MTDGKLLCFVRHGETEWNRLGRMQGSKDIPLNARGREQAVTSGELLATIHPEVRSFGFVSSPLIRTRTTMTLLRGALGLDPEAYALDDRLRERTWGDWEGSTWSEIGQNDPQGSAAHDADKWGFAPPSGESYAMLAGRMAAWLAELDGPTVAVSHGGIARVLLSLLSPVAKIDLPVLEITQGRVLVFEAGAHRWV